MSEEGTGYEYEPGGEGTMMLDPVEVDLSAAEEEIPLEPIPPAKRGNPRVRRWQQAYNASVKGTGLPMLSVDGIKGPKTRAAMQKVRQSGAKTLREFAAKVRQKPEAFTGQRQQPMAPPAPPPSLRTYESLYPRFIEMLKAQVPEAANMGRRPGLEATLRQMARRWADMLKRNPGFSDRAMTGIMQGYINQLKNENLDAFER